MSDDLKERLRAQGKDAFAKQYSLGMFKLCDEAADRIESLETAIRTALAECRGLEVYRILDRALAEGQDK